MEIREESGMKFKCEKGHVFNIEKSRQYTEKLRQNGIKSCEFILQKKGNHLYFIEAKSSCPRQVVEDIPANEKEKKKTAYDDYINDIVLKMRHSLSLYGNILLKRYSQQDVPNSMAHPDLSTSRIYLMLVINPPNGTWEPEPALQDTLRQHLHDEIKIWRIESLLVINAQKARQKGFIL